jgi:hypothetical protein
MSSRAALDVSGTACNIRENYVVCSTCEKILTEEVDHGNECQIGATPQNVRAVFDVVDQHRRDHDHKEVCSR